MSPHRSGWIITASFDVVGKLITRHAATAGAISCSALISRFSCNGDSLQESKTKVSRRANRKKKPKCVRALSVPAKEINLIRANSTWLDWIKISRSSLCPPLLRASGLLWPLIFVSIQLAATLQKSCHNADYVLLSGCSENPLKFSASAQKALQKYRLYFNNKFRIFFFLIKIFFNK